MMKCWICIEEKICLPYRSNPKGIMGGTIVMICNKCRKRVDALPERPWKKND